MTPRAERWTTAREGVARRTIDILIAGSALLVLAPLMAIIAITIKLTSPGPALFKQLSVGQPSLRVLYMSGYTDDEVIRAGRLEGWENFMEKPFTSQRLLEKVREILDS